MSNAAPKHSASADNHDSYESAKNHLVSSLCELSTAATQTASAAINFYKEAGISGPGAASAGASLKKLSDSVLAVAKGASTDFANGSVEPKKTAKASKKKEAPAAATKTPSKATAGKATKAVASSPTADSSASNLSTSASESQIDPSDPLATTDPILVQVAAEAAAAAAAAEVKQHVAASSSEKPEKVRKKRAEKDPNAPKKPLTSYLRFNLAVREQLRKERTESGRPTLQATELNQIIADKWANLGGKEKLELQRAYESDFEVYKKDVERYKQGNQNPVPSEAASKPAAEKPAAEKTVPAKPATEVVSSSTEVAKDAPVSAPVAIPDEKTKPVSKPAPVPAVADAADVTLDGSSGKDKPKKKKKSAKKHKDATDASNLLSIENIAAAATASDAANESILVESSQSSPKASKKRKDKDSSESQLKKKKTEPRA